MREKQAENLATEDLRLQYVDKKDVRVEDLRKFWAAVCGQEGRVEGTAEGREGESSREETPI